MLVNPGQLPLPLPRNKEERGFKAILGCWLSYCWGSVFLRIFVRMASLRRGEVFPALTRILISSIIYHRASFTNIEKDHIYIEKDHIYICMFCDSCQWNTWNWKKQHICSLTYQYGFFQDPKHRTTAGCGCTETPASVSKKHSKYNTTFFGEASVCHPTKIAFNKMSRAPERAVKIMVDLSSLGSTCTHSKYK